MCYFYVVALREILLIMRESGFRNLAETRPLELGKTFTQLRRPLIYTKVSTALQFVVFHSLTITTPRCHHY